MSNITLITEKGGAPRVDTRDLAVQMGAQHQNVFEMVKDYQADFEQLGKVRFETGASPGSKTGQKVKFALLNEDQCYLLLTFSRNTPHVRALKVALVQAFREARSGDALAAIEYLPGYHQLHDKAHQLAAGSANERFVHMNLNKLVNKTVGLAAGQRQTAPAPVKSLTVVAQAVALNAMDGAKDHHDGYERAKTALGALSSALTLKAA